LFTTNINAVIVRAISILLVYSFYQVCGNVFKMKGLVNFQRSSFLLFTEQRRGWKDGGGIILAFNSIQNSFHINSIENDINVSLSIAKY